VASKKTRIILIAVGAVALGAIVAVNVTRDSRNRVSVQTQKVAKADLTSVVSASGEVKPKRFVNIGANVSGRIVELAVVEGQPVKKGQVLAKVEAEQYEAGARQSEAAVGSAQADISRAQADLEVSRLDFERTKQMLQERLVSQQVFDQAEATFKMKQASVEAARRRVTQLQAANDSNRDNLRKTTVYSPMDGVVTSLPKEEGEMVIGALSFNPTVMMTVADLSVMEVEVLVDETDIRNVSLGQEAEVRVDALEGAKIKGEVTEIGSSAIPRGSSGQAGQSSGTTANQAKDFKVVVTLKDPPPTLRPGLNATADITTATRKQVLAVPIQAVVVREVNDEGKVVDPGVVQAAGGDGGPSPAASPKPKGKEKDGVFVLSAGEVTFRPVKTGVLGESEIEVLEGVKDGEEIVTGSYKTLRTLRDKAKVKAEVRKDKP
jgi:HlyD family secretion protein